MYPVGPPQLSLDKLVASINPRGLAGKETFIRGFDRGEEAGTFPRGAFLHLPHFQLPWQYSLRLTNIKHQGANSVPFGYSNTNLQT